MSYAVRLILSFLMLIICTLNTHGQSDKMALIKGGNFVPLYGTNGKPVQVKSFKMDVYPVTTAAYRAFLIQYPAWRKSKVIRLYADKNYLRGWSNDSTITPGLSEKAPVTTVSWFAAKAYCECQGKRLPTVDEWELVAMANQKKPDARIEKSYNQYILDWYEKPKTYTNEIGNTFKNYWGVYDIHGLVWEWTQDFNSVLISGESRKDVDKDSDAFCGSGSLGATDLMNYASFMRYAFRGSLKASYSVQNLGFRCVQDVKSKSK